MYICSNCSHTVPTRISVCPSCKSQNTFVKQSSVSVKPKPSVNNTPVGLASFLGGQVVKPLSQIDMIDTTERILTGVSEFDRVIGGGLVPGAIVLLGGDPGIGKSTLVAKIANGIALSQRGNTLYVSAEETSSQIRARTHRLGIDQDRNYVVYESDIDKVLDKHIKDVPDLKLLIIDSLNTFITTKEEGYPGSPSQMQYCEAAIRAYAKRTGLPVIMISHVTKQGILAGAQKIAHMVDVTLYLEGDPNSSFRILRANKSRIGDTREIGIFEMSETGLDSVSDIDRTFTSTRSDNDRGCTTSVIMEGVRPIVVDIEALANTTIVSNPLRRTMGLNKDTLSMIIASCEKNIPTILSDKEIYVNLPSNVLTDERVLDLAVAMAIMSSSYDKPISSEWIILGEVRLTGNIIPVGDMVRRIVEATRLGYTKFLIPHGIVNKLPILGEHILIYEVKHISEAVATLFS